MTPLATVSEQVHGVYLSEAQWSIVIEILRSNVPGRKVWVFGSRATGVRIKLYSDLDLALEGRLTLSESAKLSDAFEESLLPMKVDVVELDAIDAGFRDRIKPDFVPVTRWATE